MLPENVRKRAVKEQEQLSNKINKLMSFVQLQQLHGKECGWIGDEDRYVTIKRSSSKWIEMNSLLKSLSRELIKMLDYK